MAKKKLKLTRPELKRQREALKRFQRYLPMLKLKQQMLQMRLRQIAAELETAREQTKNAEAKLRPYRDILVDPAGADVEGLATPEKIDTGTENVAGVKIPVFREAVFPQPDYSLFATPPWVDGALRDLKEKNRCIAVENVLAKQIELIREELTTIIQRVNLFEKVMIPEASEAIRKIRIRLGDQMTAAVGRAKIAKAKLEKTTEVSA